MQRLLQGAVQGSLQQGIAGLPTQKPPDTVACRGDAKAEPALEAPQARPVPRAEHRPRAFAERLQPS